MRHQIIERGGGALALGGRRFININNNQMEDCVNIRGRVGEEMRPGVGRTVARHLGWDINQQK